MKQFFFTYILNTQPFQTLRSFLQKQVSIQKVGKNHVQYVHFYEKRHCYLHFEKNGTLSFSSQSRFWILGNLLLFSWPVFTVRLGLVGSLSTFLPKDSCLGAKRKRHGWPWKVEKKTPNNALLEENRVYSSMQIGAILYNTPGLLCVFFVFVMRSSDSLNSLSQQESRLWLSVGWRQVIILSYFSKHPKPYIPNWDQYTRQKKTSRLGTAPRFHAEPGGNSCRCIVKMRTFYIKKCDLVRRPRACCTYLFV